MIRRKAAITSLIITAGIVGYLHKPSEGVVEDESNHTEITIVFVEEKSQEVAIDAPAVITEEPEVVAPPEPIDVVKDDVIPTENKSETINVVSTFYTASCEGCTGITKMGDDVRNTIYVDGLRVIAADPRVIQLGSIVSVSLEDGTTFKAAVRDIGAAIKGARIDVLVSSKNEAYRLGRQQAVITIIERGGK